MLTSINMNTYLFVIPFRNCLSNFIELDIVQQYVVRVLTEIIPREERESRWRDDSVIPK